MTQHRSGQRRGLGRGLGSLIPTAAPAPSPAQGGGVGTVVRPDDAAVDPAVHPEPADSTPAPAGGSGTTALAGNSAAPAADKPERVLPEGLTPVDGAYFAELDVKSIRPNPRQPRQVFDEEALAELVHSIKEVGLLQPVVVRRLADDSYELIMGERRWRAVQEAGLRTIPAIVRETSDDDLLRDALLENLHRSRLNPLEEAAAYQQLLEDFGCTHEELASRIGRSRPQISNTLRLLKLSAAVQRRLADGMLSASHARALLAVNDPERQDRLAARGASEGISVRALEAIITLGDLGQEDKPLPQRGKTPPKGLDRLASR